MKNEPWSKGKKGKKKQPALSLVEKGSSQIKQGGSMPAGSRERDQQRRIGIDQPFDYEEVIKVTGPDYVQNLHPDGIAFKPYEDLRENPPAPPVLREECIWMKAGVINFRVCDNAYDCSSCPFDKGIRRAMGVGKDFETQKHAPEWAEHLKKRYRGESRPCRHALTGRIDAPKICTLNYECYHCTFDQMLDEADLVRDIQAPGYKSASGYLLADGYYYHMGHSWARFEHGGRVRVGFDDFLVKLFGPLQSV